MKKTAILCLFVSLLTAPVWAQHGRSISILGDSYSTFEGFLDPDTNYVWYQPVNPKNDVTNVRQTWWHQLIRQKGYRLCVNNSFSGSTICYTGYNKEDYSRRSFIARMNHLGSPDIILIFGATNDSWAKSPIGQYKYEGQTQADLYQFRPALAYLLSHILDRYPNVELHFILNSGLSDAITESCRTICAHYGVDVIELHDIDKQHGHPSIAGMRAIARQVGERMGKKGKN